MRDFTAKALALLVEEAGPALLGWTLREAAAHKDFPRDLLLFFQSPRSSPGKSRCLRVVTAPGRARLHLEDRPRPAGEAHPRIRTLSARLSGRPLEGMEALPGERACRLVFGKGEDPPGRLDLLVELFPPGNWLLLDREGRIKLAGSERKGPRPVREGEIYRPPAPPPPSPGGEEIPAWFPSEPGKRNQEAARFFGERDETILRERRRAELLGALEKALAKAKGRVRALEAQLEQTGRAGELRRRAELLKANLQQIRPGAREAEVRDWFDPELPLVRIPLEPPKPPREVMESLFKKARRLEKGRPVVEARLAGARELVQAAEEALDLAGRAGDPDSPQEGELEERLALLRKEKLLPRPPREKPGPPSREEGKIRKASGGERFRRFTSKEGFPILVGRDQRQNDILTLRVARGNDLWLHAGGGAGGSHVVVRLPRGRQAGEETLLDAAHLAIYYSKSRGRPFAEVIWTQRKWVRKPKGFPPGKVLVDRSKTLKLRFDPERLERILSTAGGEDPA